MKSDSQFKADVTAQLASDPAINTSHLGVMVEGGVVVVAGYPESFPEKYAVERAVRRVAGVRGRVLDLQVIAPPRQRSDSEVAQAAVKVQHPKPLPADGKVQVEVEEARSH